MKVSAYLEYEDLTSGSFDADKYYETEESYAEAVKKAYESSKGAVEAMMGMASDGRGTTFLNTDGQEYSLGAKAPQNERKPSYSSSYADIYGEDGKDDDVDGVIEKFVSQKPFIEMVVFDRGSMEEEFETELSTWVSEHVKIDTAKVRIGEDVAWANEPRRDLMLKFKNNAGEELSASLYECRILDVIDDSTLILYVERLRLVDDFLQK